MSKIVDFHSHILPEIDDGSASMEESISMLRMEAGQEIEHVVATPHFYARHDTPEVFLAKRNASEARLREEMAKHEGLPRLSVGAEIYFFPGISDSDVLQELTIDKKDCIILEMPQAPWSESMYAEIENISVKQGIVPIIAHVDRHIRPLRTHGIVERLADLPVLVQANAGFFLRTHTKRMALRLLRDDKIHLLGSDCHNLSSRPPNMGQALGVIEHHLGAEALQRLESYQRMLLQAD